MCGDLGFVPARRTSSRTGDSETMCGSARAEARMGRVRMFPAPAGGVRLADAVRVLLGTTSMANTRETYAAALDRLVADFGVDTYVTLMPTRPRRGRPAISCSRDPPDSGPPDARETSGSTPGIPAT